MAEIDVTTEEVAILIFSLGCLKRQITGFSPKCEDDELMRFAGIGAIDQIRAKLMEAQKKAKDALDWGNDDV